MSIARNQVLSGNWGNCILTFDLDILSITCIGSSLAVNPSRVKANICEESCVHSGSSSVLPCQEISGIFPPCLGFEDPARK